MALHFIHFRVLGHLFVFESTIRHSELDRLGTLAIAEVQPTDNRCDAVGQLDNSVAGASKHYKS